MCAVEWKKIWQVTIWDKRFSGIDKKLQPKVIKYHYYLANDLKELERSFGDIRILYTTEQVAYTDSMLVSNNISEGEIVAIPWGGNASVKYFKGKFITADNRIATSSDISTLNNKYLYYWMLHRKDELEGYYRGAGIKHPSMYSVLMMDIPIPSLAKQQEIVSHLDTFTTLISNLESELDMRRKQYEHYRNQLLDFEGVEGVEWKTLGEVGEFVRGNGIQKKDFVEDGYGCIHYGQVYTQFDLLAYETITGIEKALYDKCRKAKCGDIVLATTSENLEDVAKPVIWLGEEEIAVSGDAFIYKHNQNPIFIGSQFLTDRFSKFKGMNAKGAKVIRIIGDSMAEYKIALPSLEKQNEIAEGIKSFENLIQSLEQEIKLRKQQYEYYREKLLTFEKE